MVKLFVPFVIKNNFTVSETFRLIFSFSKLPKLTSMQAKSSLSYEGILMHPLLSLLI